LGRMPSRTRIEVVEADITKERTDAIVNAANVMLANGGGVAGAIARAAGPDLQRACDELVSRRGLLVTGEAVITDAFDLPCRKVIHAVGPIYGRHSGDEPRLLAAAHANSIALAIDSGMRSIAFPAISCGIYGYPAEEAAPIAVAAVAEACERSPIELVRFCFIGAAERSAFAAALPPLGPNS
jgi:O-acetyl-ADP-ribose deacetylase (regulator of RNase III)